MDSLQWSTDITPFVQNYGLYRKKIEELDAFFVYDGTKVITELSVPSDAQKIGLILLPGVVVSCQLYVQTIHMNLEIYFFSERDSSCSFELFVDGSFTNQLALTTYCVEPGAHCSVQVRYAAFDQQVLHITTRQEHIARNGSSAISIKGVLFDTAHVAFDGIIKVEQTGSGTNSELFHKVLLFSSDARAVGKPQLEVQVPDVSCKHGNAIGKLDEQQLQYVQSRGYSFAEAQLLLVRAFLLDKIEYTPKQEVFNCIIQKIIKSDKS